MKSASALAILAAAGLYGISPATAADLGGDCCADLEERVAELEATTARKGTRKVSLTISGQVSQQLMFWDDGIQSDMYVSGPTQSNSRWRMLGTAKISPEITAGFLYELEAFASQSTSQNQSNGSGMTVLG
ncbi:MAG: porin, partial [Hyphomicrobiaceae bacterium]